MYILPLMPLVSGISEARRMLLMAVVDLAKLRFCLDSDGELSTKSPTLPWRFLRTEKARDIIAPEVFPLWHTSLNIFINVG